MTSTTNRKWVVSIWNGESFSLASEYDMGLVSHLKRGSRVRLDVTEFRSLPRNSYYWVVLQVVIDNIDSFSTKESLHKTLLLACGVVEPVIDLDGEINMVPASTAFDKMPEEEFKRYFDNAMSLIQEKILVDVDLKELLKEADRTSGGTRKKYHPE